MSRIGDAQVRTLASMAADAGTITILTGAGCSTASGIPDYRGPEGTYRRRPPVQWNEFSRSEEVRRRFWARNFMGWPRFAAARPNRAHRAIAALEAAGRVETVITQNIDRLHQMSGSRKVIDLHGRNDLVTCAACGADEPRAHLQERLREANRGFDPLEAAAAPDGDANLSEELWREFVMVGCLRCNGMIRPKVVFFGESVARETVDWAMSHLDRSGMLLIAGSSLTVWSGYRFALRASRNGIPIAIVNQGLTRADDLAAVKVDGEVGDVLSLLAPE